MRRRAHSPSKLMGHARRAGLYGQADMHFLLRPVTLGCHPQRIHSTKTVKRLVRGCVNAQCFPTIPSTTHGSHRLWPSPSSTRHHASAGDLGLGASTYDDRGAGLANHVAPTAGARLRLVYRPAVLRNTRGSVHARLQGTFNWRPTVERR